MAGRRRGGLECSDLLGRYFNKDVSVMCMYSHSKNVQTNCRKMLSAQNRSFTFHKINNNYTIIVSGLLFSVSVSVREV